MRHDVRVSGLHRRSAACQARVDSAGRDAARWRRRVCGRPQRGRVCASCVSAPESRSGVPTGKRLVRVGSCDASLRRGRVALASFAPAAPVLAGPGRSAEAWRAQAARAGGSEHDTAGMQGTSGSAGEAAAAEEPNAPDQAARGGHALTALASARLIAEMVLAALATVAVVLVYNSVSAEQMKSARGAWRTSVFYGVDYVHREVVIMDQEPDSLSRRHRETNVATILQTFCAAVRVPARLHAVPWCLAPSLLGDVVRDRSLVFFS